MSTSSIFTPQIPSSTLNEWIKIIAKVNPQTVGALLPALGALKPATITRLVASVNAMNPDVVVTLANTLAGLTPQTWDALISLVDAGVPAINMAGTKLAMLPIQIDAPAPYSGPSGGDSSGKKSFRLPFGHH